MPPTLQPEITDEEVAVAYEAVRLLVGPHRPGALMIACLEIAGTIMVENEPDHDTMEKHAMDLAGRFVTFSMEHWRKRKAQ